jgi:hypothetical protein
VEKVIGLLASCQFASPASFWIASGLALLLLFCPRPGRRNGLRIDLAYWKSKVRFRGGRSWVLSILLAGNSLLMAAVLADPYVLEHRTVPIYGKPVMAVIDISGSMGSEPGRYARRGAEPVDRRTNFGKACAVFADLMRRRPDVDFGLLLYSTEMYIPRYFAYKSELLKDTIENQREIDYISAGTRPAEALAKARTFFADHIRGKDKAIVLISDLDVDLPEMVAVTEEMQRELTAGIKVYVIVVGRVAPRQSETDKLKIVGMYDKNGIDRICREIAEAQSSPVMEQEVASKRSLIPYLLPLILGLIALYLILSETRFRKMP